MKYRQIPGAVCACLLSLSPLSAGAATCSIMDLGTLGGTQSYGSGVNASGQVVGRSYTAGGQQAAFFYDGSSMLDLCALTDGVGAGWSSFTNAFGINDNGDIIGLGSISGQTHANAGFDWSCQI